LKDFFVFNKNTYLCGIIIHLVNDRQRKSFFDLFSEEQVNFILEVEPLNIEARYPEYKDRLAKRLTPSYCEYLIK